jgi:hypothetical protein
VVHLICWIAAQKADSPLQAKHLLANLPPQLAVQVDSIVFKPKRLQTLFKGHVSRDYVPAIPATFLD